MVLLNVPFNMLNHWSGSVEIDKKTELEERDDEDVQLVKSLTRTATWRDAIC